MARPFKKMPPQMARVLGLVLIGVLVALLLAFDVLSRRAPGGADDPGGNIPVSSATAPAGP